MRRHFHNVFSGSHPRDGSGIATHYLSLLVRVRLVTSDGEEAVYTASLGWSMDHIALMTVDNFWEYDRYDNRYDGTNGFSAAQLPLI